MLVIQSTKEVSRNGKTLKMGEKKTTREVAKILGFANTTELRTSKEFKEGFETIGHTKRVEDQKLIKKNDKLREISWKQLSAHVQSHGHLFLLPNRTGSAVNRIVKIKSKAISYLVEQWFVDNKVKCKDGVYRLICTNKQVLTFNIYDNTVSIEEEERQIKIARQISTADGVSLFVNGQWFSTIFLGGKQIFLGIFDNPVDARNLFEKAWIYQIMFKGDVQAFRSWLGAPRLNSEHFKYYQKIGNVYVPSFTFSSLSFKFRGKQDFLEAFVTSMVAIDNIQLYDGNQKKFEDLIAKEMEEMINYCRECARSIS